MAIGAEAGAGCQVLRGRHAERLRLLPDAEQPPRPLGVRDEPAARRPVTRLAADAVGQGRRLALDHPRLEPGMDVAAQASHVALGRRVVEPPEPPVIPLDPLRALVKEDLVRPAVPVPGRPDGIFGPLQAERLAATTVAGRRGARAGADEPGHVGNRLDLRAARGAIRAAIATASRTGRAHIPAFSGPLGMGPPIRDRGPRCVGQAHRTKTDPRSILARPRGDHFVVRGAGVR